MRVRREFIWKILALLFLFTTMVSCVEDDEMYGQMVEVTETGNESGESDPPVKDHDHNKQTDNETKINTVYN